MKKVLLVDDDVTFQKTTGDFLTNEGYEVHIVSNGEEGLAELKEFKPDIILLDLMMPKMSGMNFAEELQKEEGLRKIPILIVSNFNSISSVSNSMDLGIRGYIVKSEESLKNISNAVESIIGKAS